MIPSKGKPVERQGRKATGLKSLDHGRRVADYVSADLCPNSDCAGPCSSMPEQGFFVVGLLRCFESDSFV